MKLVWFIFLFFTMVNCRPIVLNFLLPRNFAPNIHQHDNFGNHNSHYRQKQFQTTSYQKPFFHSHVNNNLMPEKHNYFITNYNNVPGAYTWGYRWTDESGNQMFREESANGLGKVWGRYSFRENNGLLRIVEYVADENGYRTRIRSNEPGLVTSNPAGAEIIKFEDENNIPE